MMSARRASMAAGSPMSAMKPGSPMAPLPFGGSPFARPFPDLALDTSGADDLGGLAEDEEFAAEEHAHRC